MPGPQPSGCPDCPCSHHPLRGIARDPGSRVHPGPGLDSGQASPKQSAWEGPQDGAAALCQNCRRCQPGWEQLGLLPRPAEHPLPAQGQQDNLLCGVHAQLCPLTQLGPSTQQGPPATPAIGEREAMGSPTKPSRARQPHWPVGGSAPPSSSLLHSGLLHWVSATWCSVHSLRAVGRGRQCRASLRLCRHHTPCGRPPLDLGPLM